VQASHGAAAVADDGGRGGQVVVVVVDGGHGRGQLQLGRGKQLGWMPPNRCKSKPNNLLETSLTH